MILFINKRYNNRNGAARSGIDVVNSLIKFNSSLLLLYVDSGNNFKEISGYPNLKIIRSPRFRDTLTKFKISNVINYIEGKFFDSHRINKIKSHNIQFIIANSLSAEHYAKRLAKHLHCISCLIVRESTEFYSNSKKAANRINNFNHVVFVSSNVMEKWFSILPELRKKSTYIPNTIQESSIRDVINESKDTIKEKLNFKSTEFNIIVVGKLMKRKNQGLVIENLSKFNTLGRKVHIHFVGRHFTSYGAEVKKNLSKSSHKNMISFHGFKNNILDYIYSADCLLLTATAEASPRVIYESMALKTPVVASDIDGVPELIIDNKTGFLYKSDCIDSLILKIKELLDKTDINIITDNAYKYYHENFSNQIHMENYKQLIKLLKAL